MHRYGDQQRYQQAKQFLLRIDALGGQALGVQGEWVEFGQVPGVELGQVPVGELSQAEGSRGVRVSVRLADHFQALDLGITLLWRILVGQHSQPGFVRHAARLVRRWARLRLREPVVLGRQLVS